MLLPRTVSADQFLDDLRIEVEAHPAVSHPVLEGLEHRGDRAAFRAFGLQHVHLVGQFTRYLELLLLRATDARDKLWIAKVLVDEYGEGSDGHDHATLYRQFLAALGADARQIEAVTLRDAVREFVTGHEELCEAGDWLAGLGAVGPGHEWAIPRMFPPLVRGLQRLGVDSDASAYFPLHLEQDVDHGNWLHEALLRHAVEPAAQTAIRDGALRSLELRQRFWDAVQAELSDRETDLGNPASRQARDLEPGTRSHAGDTSESLLSDA